MPEPTEPTEPKKPAEESVPGESTVIRRKVLPGKPPGYEEFLAELERRHEGLLSESQVLQRLHEAVGLPKERVENVVLDVHFRADNAARALKLPDELGKLYAVMEGESAQRTGLTGEALEKFIHAVKRAWVGKLVGRLEAEIKVAGQSWTTDRRTLAELEHAPRLDVQSITATRKRLESEMEHIQKLIAAWRAHAPELERLRRESPFLW